MSVGNICVVEWIIKTEKFMSKEASPLDLAYFCAPVFLGNVALSRRLVLRRSRPINVS